MVDLFKDRRILEADALSDCYRSQFDIDRLHVRGVHDTWGIAEGFVVTLVAGGSALDVSEGVGYDNEGTPIVMRSPAHLEPHRTGEHDIVVTELGATAIPSGMQGWCRGSLVVASAAAVLAGVNSLRWTELRLRARWIRRRESAYVRAGSQDFDAPEESLLVSTAAARFPVTPLYFCQIDALDKTTNKPLGLQSVAAVHRNPPIGVPRHGPFFTICGAGPAAFTVLFTRSIATEHSNVTVHWVGVMPHSQLLDLGDACQVYPKPIIIL
jgi:hypothetical protein